MALYIGVMTGTSLDGIDCVVCDIDNSHTRVLAHHQDPIPSALQQDLLALCTPGDNEIERMLRAEAALADAISVTINTLLQDSSLDAGAIQAVGCHGQTIRHRPPQNAKARGYTLQICDLSTLAYRCGITCVGDFRRADMARGGQGAPMAPVFHAALLAHSNSPGACVNIGGMANISLLQAQGPISGYDTGPGNVLMDYWIHRHLGKAYDHNGDWARQGQLQPELLHAMLNHPFIQAPAPKSTGRETFNGPWLQQLLADSRSTFKAEDVQRTLLEFTAASIAKALADTECANLYVCGGGAENACLMQRLAALLPTTQVASSSELGIAPAHMEAAAFAWFAKQTLEQTPLAMRQITGASRNAIAGLVHYAR